MDKIREIHTQCYQNYLNLKSNWPQGHASLIPVQGFLNAVERWKSKIINYRKDFPLSSFDEHSSLLECTTVNTGNYKQLNKGKKIDISIEPDCLFTLGSRGVFFPIDTSSVGEFGYGLRIKPLKMYIEPDKEFRNEILGFMDNGQWLHMQSCFKTVTPGIYERNHKSSKFDTFFKEITLSVKKVNLGEWIADFSWSTNYYPQPADKKVKSTDIKQVERNILVITDALTQYLIEKHKRLTDKINILEEFIGEVSFDDIVMCDNVIKE